MVQEALLLEKKQGHARESPLLGFVHGRCRLLQLLSFRGTHFNEDDTVTIQRDQVEFAERAGEVASDNAVTEPLEEFRRRPFRAGAEPAAPEGFPGPRHGCNRSLERCAILPRRPWSPSAPPLPPSPSPCAPAPALLCRRVHAGSTAWPGGRHRGVSLRSWRSWANGAERYARRLPP